MALLRARRPQQRTANRDFASRHNFRIDTHIGVVERMLVAPTISRFRSAVAGLTWVAAHRVIGEITRNRVGRKAILESIQLCSLQVDGPSKIYVRAKSERIDQDAHRRFERREARAVDQRDVLIGRRVRLAAAQVILKLSLPAKSSNNPLLPGT